MTEGIVRELESRSPEVEQKAGHTTHQDGVEEDMEDENLVDPLIRLGASIFSAFSWGSFSSLNSISCFSQVVTLYTLSLVQ